MPEDPSARVIAEKIMSASTTDASPLFDLSPSGVLAVDGDGQIVYANAPLLRMFGYERDDLIGRPLETLVPARLADAHRDHRGAYSKQPYNRTMGSSKLHLIGRHRGGTEFPIDVAFATVVRDGVTVVFAAVVDLTHPRSVESRLQEVNRAYATLDAMTRQLRRAGDPASVLAVACNLAVAEGRYLGAWAGRPNDRGGIDVVASAGAVDDYVSGLDITLDPQSPGPIAIALGRGTATFIEDFDEHTETTPWIKQARAHGIRASATLPVRCESEVVAALTFFSDQPDVFDVRMRSVLEGIAATTQTYLEFLRSEARLHAMEMHRSELLERLVAAQERERAKIAADVHDDSIGAVVAVDLRLNLLRNKITSAAPELLPALDDLQHDLRTAIERLRTLLFDLDPPDLRVNIVDALRSAAGFVFENSPIDWRVSGEVDGPLVDAAHIQALRIANEAMLNVRVHSRAANLDIVAEMVGGGLQIVVRDDGVGVDPATITSRPGHRGMATMRDRAEISGGTFDLEGVPGEGTTVRFWLPSATPR